MHDLRDSAISWVRWWQR